MNYRDHFIFIGDEIQDFEFTNFESNYIILKDIISLNWGFEMFKNFLFNWNVRIV